MVLEMKVSSRKQAINGTHLNKMSLKFCELEIMELCLTMMSFVVIPVAISIDPLFQAAWKPHSK